MFLQARQALNRDEPETYRRLRTALAHYPLAPYLDIWQAYKEMQLGNDEAVAMALRRHAAVPEARDLHIDWIRDLAERGQWRQVSERLDDFSATAARLP